MKAAIEAANPGTTITFNFAASSALRTQLEQGAKADTFASADTVQMDNAKKADLIQGDSVIFARNTPVIIVPANNPAKHHRPGRPGQAGRQAGPRRARGADRQLRAPGRSRSWRPTRRPTARTTRRRCWPTSSPTRPTCARSSRRFSSARATRASSTPPTSPRRSRDQVKIDRHPHRVNVIAEYPIGRGQGRRQRDRRAGVHRLPPLRHRAGDPAEVGLRPGQPERCRQLNTVAISGLVGTAAQLHRHRAEGDAPDDGRRPRTAPVPT